MKITLVLLKPLINLTVKFFIQALDKYAKETKTEWDDLIVQFLKEAMPILLDIIENLENK